MKKYFIAISCVLLLLVLETRPAAACTCMLPATTHDALLQADAVFTGKVQAFVQVQKFDEDAGGLVVFSVDRAWKGTVAPVMLINSGYNMMSCQGYFWEQGQEYLVYAHRRANGTLGVQLCSRTSELHMAQQDLRALGAGAAPQFASTLWLCGGMLVFVFLLGSLLFVRRRRAWMLGRGN